MNPQTWVASGHRPSPTTRAGRSSSLAGLNFEAFLLVGFYSCRCIPFDKIPTASRLNGFVKRGFDLGRTEDSQGKESPTFS